MRSVSHYANLERIEVHLDRVDLMNFARQAAKVPAAFGLIGITPFTNEENDELIRVEVEFGKTTPVEPPA